MKLRYSLKRLTKPFYLALGWLCVGFGIVGVILPVLPTTPFLIIALWAFERSSPELSEKLRSHRVVGPYLVAWQDHGVIPLKAKIFAIAAMSFSFGYVFFFTATSVWLLAVLGILLMAVATYVVSRPSVAGQ
jgi:uncharacterized protein